MINGGDIDALVSPTACDTSPLRTHMSGSGTCAPLSAKRARVFFRADQLQSQPSRPTPRAHTQAICVCQGQIYSANTVPLPVLTYLDNLLVRAVLRKFSRPTAAAEPGG